MPNPLPACDILVVEFFNDFKKLNDGSYVDPLWLALRRALNVTARDRPYSNRADTFLSELRAQKLFAEDRDRFWRLHPRLRGRGEPLLGEHVSVQVNSRQVTLFGSDLRLNTDGPTMPVARLLSQLLSEAQPRLVVHVGLGGGVIADHQGGDVTVASRGRYLLRGELAGSAVNEQTFGGIWSAPAGLFSGINLASLQEPALMPASPHYERIPNPQPAPHTPVIRVEPTLPVLTSPRITDDFFSVASPDTGPSYWGDIACAVDMDAATVAATCGSTTPCALVVGHATPAIKRLQADLRQGWAEHMFDHFAEAAAENAAKVVERIVSRA
jgi:hypothetical protein